MYVPIYKKGENQECGNYRMIALISLASKVIMLIILRILGIFLIPELPIEQQYRMNGARRRGRPRQRWLDTLNGHSSGATISKMRRDAIDRAGWRGAVAAVARGRMRLDGHGDKVISTYIQYGPRRNSMNQ